VLSASIQVGSIALHPFHDRSCDMCCSLLRLHSSGVAAERASGFHAISFPDVHKQTHQTKPPLHAHLGGTAAYYVATCYRLYTLMSSLSASHVSLCSTLSIVVRNSDSFMLTHQVDNLART